jgi:hypothetical protein
LGIVDPPIADEEGGRPGDAAHAPTLSIGRDHRQHDVVAKAGRKCRLVEAERAGDAIEDGLGVP